jgi:hypothetical protein
VNKKSGLIILGGITLVLLILANFGIGAANFQSKVQALTGSFLPLITRQGLPNLNASPTGALYVFFSNGTTTGDAGGRAGMNTICSNTDINSHFCSFDEITNALASQGVYFNTPLSESGWLDVGYSSQNTCGSWKSSGGTYGGGINGGGDFSPNGPLCSETNKVSCCKWIR